MTALGQVIIEVQSADLGEYDVVLLHSRDVRPRARCEGGGRGGDRADWRERLCAHLPTVAVVTWREREGSRQQLRVQLHLPSAEFAQGSGGGGGGVSSGGVSSRGPTPPPPEMKTTSAGAQADGPPSLQLRKLGQLTTALREWLVLHRLGPTVAGEGVIRPELLNDLLRATPTAVHARERDDWERREKWQRLVTSVSSHQRMDDDQVRSPLMGLDCA